jgi:hypothetical protein
MVALAFTLFRNRQNSRKGPLDFCKPGISVFISHE